jgi:hypothetical protein
VHSCHIHRHLDDRQNGETERGVGFRRIALLGMALGVSGLLLAIPILEIVNVVCQHIEELHLLAELLRD